MASTFTGNSTSIQEMIRRGYICRLLIAFLNFYYYPRDVIQNLVSQNREKELLSLNYPLRDDELSLLD
ncbi:hypothetical protein RJ641_001856 [Dillenia turbinata]|uniref:Uncharacterized protein n=1 Tax=Dillenia turbinata TaxID=194707 RepID=A0AAN8VRU4_9MAGN